MGVARRDVTVTGDRVRMIAPGATEEFRVVVIADTHLALDDERGVPYRRYSARMAAAYPAPLHVRTGHPTPPTRSFVEALDAAVAERASLIVLLGDILSFPSEAAVEWVRTQLERAGIPWIYTAGNHDWHDEGMSGSHASLREEWTAKRLRPLYDGSDPLMSVRRVGGVRFLAIDDSTSTITSSQLAFFRTQAATGDPIVVLVHVPLYAPGRPVEFGCGHPEWGASRDRWWELERRERWPERHDEVTMAFRHEVFACPQVMAVLAGHTHEPSVDNVRGVAQIVAAPNAAGSFLTLSVEPERSMEPAVSVLSRSANGEL